MLDLIAYLFVIGLSRLLAALPLGAALALGRLLGSLGYHIIPIRRRVVLGNLRHVFGASRSDSEIRRIALEAYRELMMNLIEMLRASVADPRRYEPHAELEGLDRLRAAEEAGTPFIICSPHAGNFDLLAYTTAAGGVAPHVFMKPLKSPRFNRLLVGTRERLGLRLLLKGSGSLREMIGLIKRGESVGLLPDQNARSRGVTVDFLGRPASTFQGPAALHLLTNAQIVVALIERLAADPCRHHGRFIFLPPAPRSGDRKADVRRVTQQYCDVMSEAILRNPGQYFWFHRRWGKGIGSAPLSERVTAAAVTSDARPDRRQ
ncbi:MAG: lysophospholipid acyltransferase family protein [Planctomycetota bacterium]